MGADISHFKHNGVQHQNVTKATPPELVIVPSPDQSSAMASSSSSEIAEVKKVTKSHSSYTHFSDFSMFPDRFNASSSESCKPVAIIGHGHEHEEQPHFSDSLYPDHHKMKMHRSLSETPPGGGGQIDLKSGTSLPNSGFISKYNFRLRRNSESDHHETTESESLAPSETEGYRPRSLSNSKMYYFDFSLIPDKDPHCVIDERRKHYSDEKTLPTVREGTSAPVQTTLGQASKRSRKTSEGRFGFFDYSMIPDKDPKFFTSKKE